jgi:hypothetical protein
MHSGRNVTPSLSGPLQIHVREGGEDRAGMLHVE